MYVLLARDAMGREGTLRQRQGLRLTDKRNGSGDTGLGLRSQKQTEGKLLICDSKAGKALAGGDAFKRKWS